ncbi:unnamed protein product, partial [Staurois parvus]
NHLWDFDFFLKQTKNHRKLKKKPFFLSFCYTVL